MHLKLHPFLSRALKVQSAQEETVDFRYIFTFLKPSHLWCGVILFSEDMTAVMNTFSEPARKVQILPYKPV